MKFNHVLLLAGLLLILIPGGKPDAPKPGPGPAPAPVVVTEPPIKGESGVLIVYDAATARDLPYRQLSILTSEVLREWARAHNVELRVWAKSIQLADTNKADQRFKEVLDRSQPSLPWLYASIGGKGLDQKLPADLDATIAALEGVAK